MVDISDERATLGPTLDGEQSELGQRSIGLAHGNAADAEPLRQIAFGGKLLARLELSVRDRALNPPGNRLGDTSRFHFFFAPQRRKRWCSIRN